MNIDNLINISNVIITSKIAHETNLILFFFFMLLAVKSLEIFPKHNKNGRSETFTLSSCIFVELTNKKLLLPS